MKEQNPIDKHGENINSLLNEMVNELPPEDFRDVVRGAFHASMAHLVTSQCTTIDDMTSFLDEVQLRILSELIANGIKPKINA